MRANSQTRAVAFVVMSLCLVGMSCSGSALENPHKGSLVSLLPEKVGKYGRNPDIHTPRHLAVGVEYYQQSLNGTDALGTEYWVSDDKSKNLGIIVVNFSSAEGAKEALKKLQKWLYEGQGKPANAKIKEGAKRKGFSSVGERFEMCKESGGGCKVSEIIWTNGSVLFILSATLNELNRGTDLLDFESEFPY